MRRPYDHSDSLLDIVLSAADCRLSFTSRCATVDRAGDPAILCTCFVLIGLSQEVPFIARGA
jgi:hypothetical protein